MLGLLLTDPEYRVVAVDFQTGRRIFFESRNNLSFGQIISVDDIAITLRAAALCMTWIVQIRIRDPSRTGQRL